MEEHRKEAGMVCWGGAERGHSWSRDFQNEKGSVVKSQVQNPWSWKNPGMFMKVTDIERQVWWEFGEGREWRQVWAEVSKTAICELWLTLFLNRFSFLLDWGWILLSHFQPLVWQMLNNCWTICTLINDRNLANFHFKKRKIKRRREKLSRVTQIQKREKAGRRWAGNCMYFGSLVPSTFRSGYCVGYSCEGRGVLQSEMNWGPERGRNEVLCKCQENMVWELYI